MNLFYPFVWTRMLRSRCDTHKYSEYSKKKRCKYWFLLAHQNYSQFFIEFSSTHAFLDTYLQFSGLYSVYLFADVWQRVPFCLNFTRAIPILFESSRELALRTFIAHLPQGYSFFIPSSSAMTPSSTKSLFITLNIDVLQSRSSFHFILDRFRPLSLPQGPDGKYDDGQWYRDGYENPDLTCRCHFVRNWIQVEKDHAEECLGGN